MTRPWYDDFEQITLLCANLKSFHELLDERREAGFERKETLNEFIIHGTWFLDSFGQCGKFKKPEVYDEVLKRYVLVPFDFPAVISKDSFIRSIPSDASWGHGFGGSSGYPIPAGVVCPSCGKGWSVQESGNFRQEKSAASFNGESYIGKTLDDVCEILNEDNTVFYIVSPFPVSNPEWIDLSPRYKEDDGTVKNEKGWAMEARSGASSGFPVVDKRTYVIKSGDTLHFDAYRFWHIQCHQEKLANESYIEFGNALMKAGYGILSATRIPNEYGSSDWRGPWWKFKTEFGIVQLGWRKRVVDIDFSDVAPNLIVPDDTTKGPGTAHAWNEEDMIRFLRLAKEAKTG